MKNSGFHRKFPAFLRSGLTFCLGLGLLLGFCFHSMQNQLFAEPIPCLNPKHPMRIPAELDGRLLLREFGCWFPRPWETEEPEGFKVLLDALGNRASFDMLAVSSRLTQIESNAPEAVRFQADAARYGWEKYGIRILPDAEIRLSRKAFREAHPKLQMERLHFAVIEQKAGEPVSVIFNDSNLSDHYTHNYTYLVLGARPIKVWSFRKNVDGQIDPTSVKDVTAQAKFKTEENPGWCQFIFKAEDAQEDRFLCAAAAFEFLYPDLFSREALDFEREIFQRHRNVQAGGCVKDEWGFLPCHDSVPEKNHFWYSESMAKHYANLTGRNLVDDLFLMHAPQTGKESLRQKAIDDFNQMNFWRLLEFEEQLYAETKAIWGKSAMTATHPTWHPYPNVQEFRKNSLFWWRHPRDFAQTDELTPFACRTGMSKREGRVWFNEFYAREIEPYIYEEWTCAAAGGRMNIHPFCCGPNPNRTDTNFGLLPILDAGLDEARARTRLLNFACDAPLFSPAAVIFGHWGTMNWARPEFGNLTEALWICDFFAQNGFPADLIPSSEAEQKTLAGTPCWALNANGFLQYGAQEYRVLVFYAETDSDRKEFEFLRKLNENGKTRIYSLPAHVSAAEIADALADVPSTLNVGKQTPWLKESLPNGQTNHHLHPGMNAFSRRLDGAFVWTRASCESPAGEKIRLEKETVCSNDLSQKFTISAEAEGVLACRFCADGTLEMLTGANLLQFETDVPDSLALKLKIPADVALWKDSAGQWHGIFQSSENDLPKELTELPVSWKFLQKPEQK